MWTWFFKAGLPIHFSWLLTNSSCSCPVEGKKSSSSCPPLTYCIPGKKENSLSAPPWRLVLDSVPKTPSTCQWIPFHFYSLKTRLANHHFIQNTDEWPSFLILTAQIAVAQLLTMHYYDISESSEFPSSSHPAALPVDLRPVTPAVTAICAGRKLFSFVWSRMQSMHSACQCPFTTQFIDVVQRKRHFFISLSHEACICIKQPIQVQYSSSITSLYIAWFQIPCIQWRCFARSSDKKHQVHPAVCCRTFKLRYLHSTYASVSHLSSFLGWSIWGSDTGRHLHL